MESKMVKTTSDQIENVGTYDPMDNLYGNRFVSQREIRPGKEVVDTTAAYVGLPKDIVSSGGIDKFERPSRESMYAKVADDASQGVGKRFIPKGRK